MVFPKGRQEGESERRQCDDRSKGQSPRFEDCVLLALETKDGP